MNKRRVIWDLILNIVAVTLPNLALQLLSLPMMASRMDGDAYGLQITMVAILTVVPATMGNVLNNIRLLRNEEYIKAKCEGDFNRLSAIMSALSAAIMLVAVLVYDPAPTAVTLVLTALLSLLYMLREYHIVGFRIQIDFVSILVCNCLLAVGYVVGYGLYLLLGQWQWVYIIGYLLSFLYILLRTRLWKESYKKTALCASTSAKTTMLLLAKMLNRAMTYADKLLLYPILGGVQVSIYYVATLFGKLIAMIVSPINSVVLTYLAKLQKRSDRAYQLSMLTGAVFGIVAYLICIVCSRPILSLLYPQYVESAMKLILITTATMVMQTMISICDPFILRFFETKWQIVLNGTTVLLYCLASVVLTKLYGLIGFCIGGLMCNTIKFIAMQLIYYRAQGTLHEG